MAYAIVSDWHVTLFEQWEVQNAYAIMLDLHVTVFDQWEIQNAYAMMLDSHVTVLRVVRDFVRPMGSPEWDMPLCQTGV